MDGYTRNAEKLLPSINAYCNIPLLVTYTIIQYYYIREIFVINDKHVTLNADGTVATHNEKSEYDAVFGNILIAFKSDLIYEWNIKILDRGIGQENIGIGI